MRQANKHESTQSVLGGKSLFEAYREKRNHQQRKQAPSAPLRIPRACLTDSLHSRCAAAQAYITGSGSNGNEKLFSDRGGRSYWLSWLPTSEGIAEKKLSAASLSCLSDGFSRRSGCSKTFSRFPGEENVRRTLSRLEHVVSHHHADNEFGDGQPRQQLGFFMR